MDLNLQPPFLGPMQPVYPHLVQLVRVTSATVPGPVAGSALPAPSLGQGTGYATLYVSFVQQLRTDTQLPRDREPCLATDVTNTGLWPGYYIARLAGSYNSLPVYEVAGNPGMTSLTSLQLGTLYGSLTPSQLSSINNLYYPVQIMEALNPGLTQQQITNLSNLTLLQQTILSQLNPVQFSQIINLTLQQISNLSLLTLQQLTTLLNSFTFPQLQYLTSNLTADQILALLSVLTPAQLLTLMSNLTPAQLIALTYYDPATIAYLVTNNTILQLQNILNQNPLPPVPAGATANNFDLHGPADSTGVPDAAWYTSARYPGSISVATPGATHDLIYALPFFSPRGGKIAKIGVKPAGTFGQKIHLGIYAAKSFSNIYPTQLLADSGELVTIGGGLLSATINTTLTGNNLYWLVLLGDNTAGTVYWGINLSNVPMVYGMDPSLINEYCALQSAQAYGALPNIFPAGGSLLSQGAIQNLPMIAVNYGS